MKILIIGSGGREYALGKKIKTQNPSCNLFFAPGNGGTLSFGQNIALSSIQELVAFANSKNIELTIVGPEQLLVEGIVDAFQKNHLPIFGPNKAAAQLEGSKAFAKNFMQKYGVKTAQYKVFQHYVDAQEYIEKTSYPLVIKASGLAAGKGVVICRDHFEAEQTLKDIMQNQQFGEAGNEVVIEEFLEGFEASILSFYNGKNIQCMLSAQDHKKIGEGETGLNTGGMGALVPNPQFSEKNFQDFKENILTPTLLGIQQEKLHFQGVIFFGIMITQQGCYLLEYNMRWGDPETQTLLPLMENNLLKLIQDTLEGKDIHFNWSPQKSICVVISSGGYPLNYDKGYVIEGLHNLQAEDYDIAGAKKIDNTLITNGGRVLNILAQADNFNEAQELVYEKIEKIRFDYNYYRKDIGNT